MARDPQRSGKRRPSARIVAGLLAHEFVRSLQAEEPNPDPELELLSDVASVEEAPAAATR